MPSAPKKHKAEEAPAAGGHPAHPRSHHVLRTPKLNKFTCFCDDERNTHSLRGLLPPAIETIAQQVKREITVIRRKQLPIDRYEALMHLFDRNQRLFFRVLSENVEEFMPLVYTPTVGEACMRWSEISVAPKGLYLTLNDIGHVDEILGNWGEPEVRAIVVTDGERILGLGDLGANGMGIPLGKLQLYTACGGIPPHQTLPVTLDVGTNNTALRESEMYLGTRTMRERGARYEQLVDEFMVAVRKRWGKNCMVQFEDFGNSTAFHLLEKYRNDFCTFNDDIQGTASVTLAAVISSLRVTSKTKTGAKRLGDHSYVFLGAGEAGCGIAELIARAICEEDSTVTIEQARQKIWLVDSTGLVSTARTDKLAHHKVPFAHELSAGVRAGLGDNAKGDGKQGDHASLVNIVNAVKCSVLIGVSAQPQTFTQPVLEAMMQHSERPVVFALSNPTDKSECTAEQAVKWTNGRVVFATGSPFPDVELEAGKPKIKIGQANNAYIFPGLALGVIGVNIDVIPDDLLLVAARALAEQVQESDLATGSLFPPLQKIREVSAHIAFRVAERGYKLGVATLQPRPADLKKYLEFCMYSPTYDASGSVLM